MNADGHRTDQSRRGRPPDASADGAIRAATLSSLAEVGFDGLTMDRIATTAGVSKATIYRRWSNKNEVVLAAVEGLADEVPVPDTGALRADLGSIAEGLVRVFSEPRTALLVGTLLAQAVRDPVLAASLRQGFLARRRQAARVALERGQARGEVDAHADLEAAVDLLAAPFYYRVLVTGDDIDDRFAAWVADAVVAWVSPRDGACGS